MDCYVLLLAAGMSVVFGLPWVGCLFCFSNTEWGLAGWGWERGRFANNHLLAQTVPADHLSAHGQ